MKILESYKKMAKSMLIEHAWDRKFGESLPTLEDVMNEEDVMSHVIKYKDEDGNEKEITVKSALQAGESHPAYKQASDIADKGQAGLAQKDKEEPAGKLGGGDFERDFDDSEPEGGEEPSGAPDDSEPEGGESSGELEDEANDILDTVFTDVDTGESDIPRGENLAIAAKQISKISGAEFSDELQKDLEDFEDLDLEDDDDYSPGELNRIKATEANKIKKQLDQHIKGLKKTGGEEPSGEPDDDKPDSSVARKKLAKMSRKELAKTEYPFDDDDNYLGSDDYDPEEDTHSAPDLDGLEDVDRTTLKQKYMDLEAHKQKMEYDMEDAESQDDSDWEEESRDNFEAAVKNQNKILQLLKPQMPTTDMGGRSTRGGIGIRDSVTINGKKYKEVKEEKKVTEKHILREMYEKIGGK